MTSEALTFQDLNRLHDPLLLPWLDLYETAFPPSERILVSGILQNVIDRERGESTQAHLLAVTDAENTLIGMAMFSLFEEHKLAYLWYLAVDPNQRSQGLGSRIYQEILLRVKTAGMKALVYEVEIPEGDNAVNALRRIHFYRKQGAFLLEGIHYMQNVGWHQEPIAMHIMIHPLGQLDARAAFDLANALFEGTVEQVGDLQLV